ncbi:hypothetical protein ACNF5D_27995, partial [Escherichia coli]
MTATQPGSWRDIEAAQQLESLEQQQAGQPHKVASLCQPVAEQEQARRLARIECQFGFQLAPE